MHFFVHQQQKTGDTQGQAQDLESITFLRWSAFRVVTYLLALPTPPERALCLPSFSVTSVFLYSKAVSCSFAVFPCWNILRRWWGSRWQGIKCPGRVWWTQKHKTLLNNAEDAWFCVRALQHQWKRLLRMFLWKYVQEQACLILFHPLHVTLENQDKLHFF